MKKKKKKKKKKKEERKKEKMKQALDMNLFGYRLLLKTENTVTK